MPASSDQRRAWVAAEPSQPQQRKAACLALKAFITVVRFVAPPAQAAEWTADANRIRAVLAC